MRVDWKPGTLIYPLPAVLISCGSMERGEVNILTASWVSTVCTNPPMCVVVYNFIKESLKNVRFYANMSVPLQIRGGFYVK